jgi:hypothetical protein
MGEADYRLKSTIFRIIVTKKVDFKLWGNTSRRDLCGGSRATGFPTATATSITERTNAYGETKNNTPCCRIGSQRVTLRHFSNCPPPNPASKFPSDKALQPA